MKKLLKWIVIFLGIILLLVILATLSVTTFVNPNRFKPLITERITRLTGHPITIVGDLSWKVFPNIGIQVDHVVLQNPEGFQEKVFADIAEATVMIKLFPLFKHKVESSGITIDGMTLHLIKDAKGNNNWDFKIAKNVGVFPNSPEIVSQNPAQKTPYAFAIAGIHITNSTITWSDEQKKQSVVVKNFEFHAKDINFINPIPVTTSFDYQSQNPALQGRVTLKADIAMNLPSQIFALKNVDLNLESDKRDLHLTGDMTADLKRETLQWTSFAGEMGKLKFSGKMSGTEIKSAPKFEGHVTLAPMDMRDWLKDEGFSVQNIQTLKPVSGDVDFVFGTKPFSLQGKFKAGTLQINHMTFNNINLPTTIANGVLTISPIKADFYQGIADGSATLNLSNQKVSFDMKLHHFETRALLKDMMPAKTKLTLEGSGDVNLSVKTEGATSDAKIKNLNGKGDFRFNQGAILGIDIPNLINSAYAIIKKTPLSSNNTGQTPFNELAGTFNIQNGVISNQDFRLTAQQFTVNGQGKIDLPRNNIYYQLKTLLNKASVEDKNGLMNLYGVAIPILISGDLQNPHIGLDTSDLGKTLAEIQAKKVEIKIKDQLKGKKASEILNKLFGH